MILRIPSAYTASYDAAGNMTCRAPSSSATCAGTQTGAQLTFDNEGRLAAWQNAPSNPTSTTANLYDGAGTRVEQQVTSGSSGSTTVYVGNIEEVSTSAGATITTTSYYAGGQRIAQAVNGVFSYLGSDGLGSALVSLDANGNVQASILYDPYGNVRYVNGAMPGSYGFTGQHADGATGLDDYNARYYDPVAGQFASADSVADGLNRYGYVAGNPETRTDPSGHSMVCGVDCTGVDDGGGTGGHPAGGTTGGGSGPTCNRGGCSTGANGDGGGPGIASPIVGGVTTGRSSGADNAVWQWDGQDGSGNHIEVWMGPIENHGDGRGWHFHIHVALYNGGDLANYHVYYTGEQQCQDGTKVHQWFMRNTDGSNLGVGMPFPDDGATVTGSTLPMGPQLWQAGGDAAHFLATYIQNAHNLPWTFYNSIMGIEDLELFSGGVQRVHLPEHLVNLATQFPASDGSILESGD